MKPIELVLAQILSRKIREEKDWLYGSELEEAVECEVEDFLSYLYKRFREEF
jgi:hypothetical protein